MTRKLIISLFIFLIFFTTCRYKEGPMISFRTVSMRIQGTWQVTEYTSNGSDSLQFYNDSCGANVLISDVDDYNKRFGMTFKNGKKDFFSIIILSADNKTLNVSSDPDYYGKYFTGPFSPDLKSSWHILKLTKNELKVTIDINDKNYKMSLKKIK